MNIQELITLGNERAATGPNRQRIQSGYCFLKGMFVEYGW